MNLPGFSDSIASVIADPRPCPHCDSSSHIAGGLCVGCLLEAGLDPADEGESETLTGVLAEVNLPDQNWRLGNYEILEEIGRGGMGVIYRARQRHSRRIVAVKRVLSYHSDSRETLARFRREAQAAASLDHPNILPIYEVSESEDGLPFFSMKFAPGGTLQQIAPALRNEPWQCVALVAKIARAVQYAHSRGILHRDLKPGNILLDARGEPLVSDFGLAKWLDTSSDLTRTLTIFGTPGYIAPEQASHSAAELKPTADIYSLGAILFDLLAGRPPFLGAHALSVIRQAAESPAPKLRTLSKIADRDLETICSRCLEREPKLRYPSAHDLAEDLERWLEGRPIIARPVFPTTKVWRWSKRNPKLAASIAACFLFGAVAGMFQVQNRATARTAAMAMHSVMVEALLDLDTAQKDAELGNDLAAALQRELSRIGPARVISTEGNAQSIANGNKARVALEGTRRIRDGKLRISLRLIDTANGNVILRKILDDVSGDAGNKAAIAAGPSIYALLDLSDLSTIEDKEIDPGWRNENTRELLITGRAVMQRRTILDIDRAIELFEKAAKAESQSALAYSYLAELESARASMTGDSKFLVSAEAAVGTAARLRPNVSETHKAMSSVLFAQGRFRESLEEGFIAYELADADDDRLPSRVAANFQVLGELDKAVAWLRLALGKGYRPGDNEHSLADCLVEITDDDGAEAIYRRTSSLFPELPYGWVGLCHLALLHKDPATARQIASEYGPKYRDFVFSEQMAAQLEFFSRNFAEAEKLYQSLAAIEPDGGKEFYGATSYKSVLGRLHLAAQDKRTGTRILEEALKQESDALALAPENRGILYRMAAIQSSLGKTESAIANLRMAAMCGWVDYRSTEIDPRFDTISADPRFRNIIRGMQTKVQNAKENLSHFRSRNH